jgi:hypothetical protein
VSHQSPVGNRSDHPESTEVSRRPIGNARDTLHSEGILLPPHTKKYEALYHERDINASGSHENVQNYAYGYFCVQISWTYSFFVFFSYFLPGCWSSSV